MDWNTYNKFLNKIGDRLMPNDLVLANSETIKFIEEKIQLTSEEMNSLASKRFKDATNVLIGKSNYSMSDVGKAVMDVDKGAIMSPRFLRGLSVEMACFELSNPKFGGVPDKFLVKSIDENTGVIYIDNLQVVKDRVVYPEFQEKWNYFIEILPLIPFPFDKFNLLKLGCRF